MAHSGGVGAFTGQLSRDCGRMESVTAHLPPAVVVRDLHVRFGDVEAVNGVDLEAQAGQATALLGRNGAGKSTTMRVLAGVVPADLRHGDRGRPGRARGPDRGEAAHRLLPRRRRPGAAGHPVGAPPALRAAAADGRLGGPGPPDARALRARVVAHRVTSGFSHGMGRRMSVLLAAFHEPDVLLLDEPFDGVDPLGVEATMEVISDARARGASVLVSTHLRELAMQVCGAALVLRAGEPVANLEAAQLVGEDGAGVYRALLD